MPLFLGLDCGGSTTRAMVIDEDENVVFEGRGGPANLSSTPTETIHESLGSALIGAPQVESAVGAFAGLLGEDTFRDAAALIGRHAPCLKWGAYADYVAALAAAPAGTDVVVIAGTGSVICSWQDGQPVKSGGGGPLLGDEGSAFDIGRTALRYLCLDDPEVQGSDELWDAVEVAFGTRDRHAVPAHVNRAVSPVSSLASLAPVIGADFAKNLSYAKIAVNQAAAGLIHRFHNHVDKHVPWKDHTRVALAGGLWDASPVYQAQFEFFLNYKRDSDPTDSDHRQYHVERLDAPPVLGAARLAKVLFYEH